MNVRILRKTTLRPSLEYLVEQLAVDSHVKGLGHVHGTHKDLRSMPQEVIHCLKYSICAHIA